MSNLSQFIDNIFAIANVDNDPIQSSENILTLLANSEEYDFPLFNKTPSSIQKANCSVYWLISSTSTNCTVALYANNECLIEKSFIDTSS